MVDKDNKAYLIDIEGAKYHDVEEKLSFMAMRFDNMFKGMEADVDEQRMFFILYVEFRLCVYEKVGVIQTPIYFFGLIKRKQ